MDKSERIAQSFLKYYGFSDVRYEPDGNIPPDFLCDNRIAVEVRRLNQTFADGATRKGLEVIEIPLMQRMRKLLSSLGPPTRNQSWFVFYTFARPIPDWKVVGKTLARELKAFIAAVDHQQFKRQILPGFEIEAFKASKCWPHFFLLGGYMDDDSGGWIIPELVSNIKYCIVEKTRKIEPVSSRYPEWWLILIDHVAYGVEEHDIAEIKGQLTQKHPFKKIVLLDPRNHTRAFDL